MINRLIREGDRKSPAIEIPFIARLMASEHHRITKHLLAWGRTESLIGEAEQWLVQTLDNSG